MVLSEALLTMPAPVVLMRGTMNVPPNASV